jgi:hypothetical protein
MAIGKSLFAVAAALSLVATPALAQVNAAQTPVDTRATTPVADSEEGFGGSAVWIVLLIVAAAAAAIVLVDKPDSP